MATPKWLKRRFTHQCSIDRQDAGTAQTSTGQPSESFTTLGTDISCKFIEENETYPVEGVGQVTVKERKILFEHNQDVQVDDRVFNLVDANGTAVGIGTATITDIVTNRDIKGVKHHRVAMLEKVEIV